MSFKQPDHCTVPISGISTVRRTCDRIEIFQPVIRNNLYSIIINKGLNYKFTVLEAKFSARFCCYLAREIAADIKINLIHDNWDHEENAGFHDSKINFLLRELYEYLPIIIGTRPPISNSSPIVIIEIKFYIYTSYDMKSASLFL